MVTSLTRREVLALLGASSAHFLLGCDSARPTTSSGNGLPKVAVVGGGISGVLTAWLLDGQYDVTLYESEDELGGNVDTVAVNVRGQSVLVDLGAQYVHPGLYPNYFKLLKLLGIENDDPAKSDLFQSTSSFTLFAKGEPTPRFVSPILDTRPWTLAESWNGDGVNALMKINSAAKTLDVDANGWNLTLGDWCDQIGLTANQRDNILIPWQASLFSGRIDQSRQLSARSTMVFLSRTTGANPTDPVYYRTLRHGLGQVIDKTIAQNSTVTVRLKAPVTGITAVGAQVGLTVGGTSEGPFDHVVLAAPGHASYALLKDIPAYAAQAAALQKVEWYDSHLAIHSDNLYNPGGTADQPYGSFLNCQIEGNVCQATMDLSISVAPAPDGQPIGLYKSWIDQRSQKPQQIVHEIKFKHFLPSVQSMAATDALAKVQGQGGLWFAGGWSQHFDTQETGLISALQVAKGLLASATVHGKALAG